jgi:hypothetical protein
VAQVGLAAILRLATSAPSSRLGSTPGPLGAHRGADPGAGGRSVLVCTLGLPAEKFNDDRLARTLQAISPHCQAIWQDIVHRALTQADIDLSVIFYDLTVFVAHGSYPDSQLLDFGFAHNTPMGKRKLKAGLDVAADGNIPTGYVPWSERTADLATVQTNMERLSNLLEQRGWPKNVVLVVGDRANLNDELALAYDERGLRYLAGLKPQRKEHRTAECPGIGRPAAHGQAAGSRRDGHGRGFAGQRGAHSQ